MPPFDLSEDEINNFIENIRKIINAHQIRWQYDDRRKIYKFQLKVETPIPEYSARLVGEHNPRNDKTKFALLLNDRRIRCLEYGPTARHTNPNGTKIRGLHKHKWTDLYEDREAYVPEDIDTTSPEKAFRCFIEECKIEFKGKLLPIPSRPTRQEVLDV